jgi:hypothetical protein
LIGFWEQRVEELSRKAKGFFGKSRIFLGSIGQSLWDL